MTRWIEMDCVGKDAQIVQREAYIWTEKYKMEDVSPERPGATARESSRYIRKIY
jgi:hypothetical protein